MLHLLYSLSADNWHSVVSTNVVQSPVVGHTSVSRTLDDPQNTNFCSSAIQLYVEPSRKLPYESVTNGNSKSEPGR